LEQIRRSPGLSLEKICWMILGNSKEWTSFISWICIDFSPSGFSIRVLLGACAQGIGLSVHLGKTPKSSTTRAQVLQSEERGIDWLSSESP
jgi:hypothetical protein